VIGARQKAGQGERPFVGRLETGGPIDRSVGHGKHTKPSLTFLAISGLASRAAGRRAKVPFDFERRRAGTGFSGNTVGYALFDRQGFARQCCLLQMKVRCFDEARVSGYEIARADANDIASDDQPSRQLVPGPITLYGCGGRKLVLQSPHGALGTKRLPEVQPRAEKDDAGDDGGARHIAEKRRRRTGNEENDDQRIGGASHLLDPFRSEPCRRHFVRAVRLETLRSISRGQTCSGRAEARQRLLRRFLRRTRTSRRSMGKGTRRHAQARSLVPEGPPTQARLLRRPRKRRASPWADGRVRARFHVAKAQPRLWSRHCIGNGTIRGGT
jgi:hypothetical protein